MLLKTEIKDFVKKVLMLWILLSLFINLLVTYFLSIDSKDVYANSNTNISKFKVVDNWFLWVTWVAVSLNVWTNEKSAKSIPVTLTKEVLPISYIISNKTASRDKVITSNMQNLFEYLNLLKTDLNSLLDQSSDREAMLETFRDELQARYKSTTDNLIILNQQWSELQSTITSSNKKISSLKLDLTSSYKKLDYEKTQENIDLYLEEKDKNTYATTYLVFISKFVQSYQILNNYNKVLLDTIINNREALIKNSSIVLPNSWTELLKKLNLVKTEAEAKSTTPFN